MKRSVLLVLLAVGPAAFGLGVASGASVTVTPKLLSAYRTCVLTGVSSASTADTDSYVQEDNATTNQGGAISMKVKSTPNTKSRRAFIRFDLNKCTTLPTNASGIKSATLRLHVTTIPANTTRTYEVRPASASWVESGPGSITWANQPTAGALTATFSVCASPAASCNNIYKDSVVTPDVKLFVTGTANYGWRISDSAEIATANETVFDTREGNDATKGPQLVIVYSP